MSELQLQDYEDGYRFRIKCRACGYGWYEEPSELLVRSNTHRRMYLEEVETRLVCRACHRANTAITPLIITATHHFVGGMV